MKKLIAALLIVSTLAVAQTPTPTATPAPVVIPQPSISLNPISVGVEPTLMGVITNSVFSTLTQAGWVLPTLPPGQRIRQYIVTVGDDGSGVIGVNYKAITTGTH